MRIPFSLNITSNLTFKLIQYVNQGIAQSLHRNFKHILFCFCGCSVIELLVLDFQIIAFGFLKSILKKNFHLPKFVLSHNQVALLKCFVTLPKNCASQTVNHAASRIKQV